MRPLVPVLILLAACSEKAPMPEANTTAPDVSNASASSTPSKSDAPPAATAFSAEEDTDLYGFKYDWPAEAAANAVDGGMTITPMRPRSLTRQPDSPIGC